MTSPLNLKTAHFHGPDNAEHELRKAYNCIIESELTFLQRTTWVPHIEPRDARSTYEKAFALYRDGKKLAAERWARAAKHLARAFWHEAKIHFLNSQTQNLPFLTGAQDEEYNLYERADSTSDLLASLQSQTHHLGGPSIPSVQNYLDRGQYHLNQLKSESEPSDELLRAERIKAAYEYGRGVECLNLGWEAMKDSRPEVA